MPNESKVYVINPKKTVDPRKIVERTLKPAPETNRESRGRSRSEKEGGRNVRAGSLPLVFLSYLLGPLSILVTRTGKSSRPWVALSVGSALILLSILFGWDNVLARFGERGFVILPLMLVASVALIIGFTVWARGIFLLGRDRPLLARDLPDPVRRPGVVGLIGFLLPGLGLLVTGHYRRASFTVWLMGLMAMSAFVLSRAEWLWSWNRNADSEGIRGTTLEHLFIVMGTIALFGVIVWIVQALDGMRLAEHRFVQGARPSGGTAAFALLSAMILFVLAFEPASVAETLDDLALSARHEGYRLLPLHAELAAMRLDPSRPAFAVEAAELYDQLGEHERARVLRDDLFERWRPCIGAMQRHGMLDPYLTDRMSVSDDSIGEEPSGETGTVSVETPREEGAKSPWDRLQSEYGLFSSPFGRETVMVEGI